MKKRKRGRAGRREDVECDIRGGGDTHMGVKAGNC